MTDPFRQRPGVNALNALLPGTAPGNLGIVLTEHGPDFLRATIPKFRDDRGLHATLGQQMDICASYLALMQVRMGGRLAYTVQADDAVRALSFPPSLLITLVENAIKHGIEPSLHGGEIGVTAEAEGDSVCIRVHDSGVGIQ